MTVSESIESIVAACVRGSFNQLIEWRVGRLMAPLALSWRTLTNLPPSDLHPEIFLPWALFSLCVTSYRALPLSGPTHIQFGRLPACPWMSDAKFDLLLYNMMSVGLGPCPFLGLHCRLSPPPPPPLPAPSRVITWFHYSSHPQRRCCPSSPPPPMLGLECSSSSVFFPRALFPSSNVQLSFSSSSCRRAEERQERSEKIALDLCWCVTVARQADTVVYQNVIHHCPKSNLLRADGSRRGKMDLEIGEGYWLLLEVDYCALRTWKAKEEAQARVCIQTDL